VAIAFLRTVILYFVIMAGLRLMGKRQIGELEPAELVLTMMISDLATVPMQDFGIPLLSGLIPILTLLALSMLLSQLSLKSLRFRALVCGTPTVLIDRGRICQAAMQKNRFTIDELLEELRGQGFSEISAVKFAILENSGQLSVLPWPQEQPAAVKHLHQVVPDDVALPTVLINDGRTLQKNLEKCGKDGEWLRGQLALRGLSSPGEVFLMTLTGTDTVACIAKEDSP
jgi:Predicted membrane protein